ncbi:MAG: hypothetical protein NTU44_17405 [Bacteroidetes bacterium]|nr:hypothetical protein [Bacteroidota bacterium]
MKPGSKNIKVFLKFEEAELALLQENTHLMAESFGLDRRIDRLTGKRKVGFYLWDLECLDVVVDNILNESNADKTLVNGLYTKIKNAIGYIDKAGKSKRKPRLDL